MTYSVSRSEAPVFVVGSPRSGTTWLYHLLVSGGSFANFRSETHFYDQFVPRYGSPENIERRQRLVDAWLASSNHVKTRADGPALRPRLLEQGDTAGRLLDLIMQGAVAATGAGRWADCTPEHARFLPRIASELPNALFIHIVRDGRDVALSLSSKGWMQPSRWDPADELLVAGWQWERIVRQARRAYGSLGPRILEVRYEDLIDDLAGTLAIVGSHVGEEIDLHRIEQNPIGSVARPNTSFPGADFNPVGRWRHTIEPDRLATLESTIGDALQELGYPLSTAGREPAGHRIDLRLRKAAFTSRAAIRQLLKYRTPLGRVLAAEPGGGS